MGTRNLTMLIHGGETKIAQYGQWDGYPSGQGITVLKFLKRLEKPTVNKRFMAKLKRLKFIDDEKQKEINTFLKRIGAENGWMNMDQADLYHKEYPLLTRDNGAEILRLVYGQKGRDTIWVSDDSEFMTDGLFNEWSYIIDLDKRVLEVYKGFSKVMPPKESRFYQMIVDSELELQKAVEDWDKKATLMTDKGVSMEAVNKAIGQRPYIREEPYYTALVHSFNIDNLPTEEEFIEICTPKDEDEE